MEVCQYCGKREDEFCSSKAFKAHLKMHIPISAPCSQCPSKFDTKKKLSQHTKRVHNNENYVCNQCQQIFKRKDDLKTHENSHNNNRIACDKCDKEFSTPKNLKRHSNKMHGKLVCDICSEKAHIFNIVLVCPH